jgi:hypothetical protein
LRVDGSARPLGFEITSQIIPTQYSNIKKLESDTLKHTTNYSEIEIYISILEDF